MIRRVAGVLAALLTVSGCGGPQFTEDASTAVARLSGTVCGKPLVASAVVIRDELMLTAAHNVAGADEPLVVEFEDGTTHQATVVGFDIHRDIAFLSSPGMHRLPIRMADPVAGGTGTVLRLDGSDLRVVPYSASELVTAVGHDIFDDPSDVRRVNLRIDAPIGSGFSGAPVISADETLVGIVNARSRQSALIYAVVTAEIRASFAVVDLTTVATNDRCVP